MKKLLIAFAAVALVATANAQGSIKFGVKAGLSVYNFGGDDADDFIKGSKIGFNAGGLVNIPVSSMFSVQPEVIFNMEGAKEDDTKLTNGYINIPVMLQYNNASGFYAELGPQIGFLISSKAKNDDDEEDTKDLFKSTNFSLGLGLGYKLKSGLGFGARYNLGLGTVISEDLSEDAKVTSSGFQVGLSYTFGGSKK
jgi:hypothetical protein